jgi:hypothetical protein
LQRNTLGGCPAFSGVLTPANAALAGPSAAQDGASACTSPLLAALRALDSLAQRATQQLPIHAQEKRQVVANGCALAVRRADFEQYVSSARVFTPQER